MVIIPAALLLHTATSISLKRRRITVFLQHIERKSCYADILQNKTHRNWHMLAVSAGRASTCCSAFAAAVFAAWSSEAGWRRPALTDVVRGLAAALRLRRWLPGWMDTLFTRVLLYSSSRGLLLWSSLRRVCRISNAYWTTFPFKQYVEVYILIRKMFFLI